MRADIHGDGYGELRQDTAPTGREPNPTLDSRYAGDGFGSGEHTFVTWTRGSWLPELDGQGDGLVDYLGNCVYDHIGDGG